MQILFAITGLCLLVLLWAGLAIRRHVRAAAHERAEKQRPPAKAAIELELKQELRAEQMEKGFFGTITDPQPSRHSISKTRAAAVRDSALRTAVVRDSLMHVAEVAAEPASEPVRIPETAKTVEVPQPEVAAAVVSKEETPVEQHAEAPREESRKPPVSIGGGEFERLDLTKFNNKDLGDLSDPYQIPRTATRNRS
jgi:hypothetical protein